MIVYDDDDYDNSEKQKIEPKTAEVSFYDDMADKPVALALSYYAKLGAEELKSYLNHTPRVFTKGCETDKGLRMIYQNFSPYLYPFSVEYSILVGELKFHLVPLSRLNILLILQWVFCSSYGKASEVAKTVELRRQQEHPRQTTATRRQVVIILKATLYSTLTAIPQIKDFSVEL